MMRSERGRHVRQPLTLLVIAAGATALMTTAAFATKIDLGFHTKSQIHKICAHAKGLDTAGTAGTWGCNGKDWLIACKNLGEVCVISWRSSPGDPEVIGSGHATAAAGTGGSGGSGGGGGIAGGPGGIAGVGAINGSHSGNPGGNTGAITGMSN